MSRLNASLGTVSSIALHAAAGFFVVVGWPYLNPPAPEPVPAIPVELITEAELADRVEIPETTKAEEPPEEPEPEPEPEPEEPEPEPEPAQPEPEPEPDPEPAPPEPEPEPEQPEPEPEPEPEPQQPEPEPEPEPQTDELDFASLEDGLVDLDPDKRERPREVPDEGDGGEVDAERVGLGQELLASEEALIRANVEGRCWNRQSGVPNQEQLVVTVSFSLDRSGNLSSSPRVKNAGQIARSGNPFWRVAQDRAVAAVQECAPYDYLSAERYDVWKDIEMNFIPPAG